MPSVYIHGNRPVVPPSTGTKSGSPPSSRECETITFATNQSSSLLTHTGNIVDGRLVYDIPTALFRPSGDPIDDRLRKNTLLIDWCKRLDTHLLAKYSYECIIDPEQLEVYHYLSSLVQAREAINFLTVLVTSPKAIHTEYYVSIRDIYSFLREAGEERYPCMIQLAAILATLARQRLLPINPTWGFIRTTPLEASYAFGSQVYTIKTNHIIVMQTSTKFIRQRDAISDMAYYRIFAAAVGLQPSKYSSIVEWVLLNCGQYNKSPRRIVKPLFTSPLTDQALGSVVYIDGMAEKLTGVLLANNNTTCSVLITDGGSSYIEPNIQKALVNVAPSMRPLGENVFMVC